MSALYDRIGHTYDKTRKADPEILHRLHQHLQVRQHDSILDVACGTGNYSIALSQLGLSVTGVDISEEMIEQARFKPSDVKWIKVDVRQIPHEDALYQGATCVLAIHHFDDLLAPFKEVYRVVNHGRFVIFTASPEQMRHYWLNAYFPNAMETSINQMPPTEQVISNLREAGFSMVGVESFLIESNIQDFFLYSGKLHPQMYLYAAVRHGISTFSSLAMQEEIESGCQKLKKDIDSGKIHDVMQTYMSVRGDYLFIVAQK